MNPRRSIFDRAHRFPTWETMGWEDPEPSWEVPGNPRLRVTLNPADLALLASFNISPE